MDYNSEKSKVLRHIAIADHILTMTYPLMNDPKLLKLVIRNIYHALDSALSILHHFDTRHFMDDTFVAKIYKSRPIMIKHGLSSEYVKFLCEISEIMESQRTSDVEFVRRDKFIFANRDYDLNIVDIKKMKDYLTKTKLFANQVIGVIEK